MLIQHRADVNARDFKRSAALAACRRHKSAACAQFLLDCGADINHSDSRGLTALMAAAKSGSPAVIKLLVQRRADCSLKNADGETALDLADDDLKHLLLPAPDAPPAPFPTLDGTKFDDVVRLGSCCAQSLVLG